MINFYRKIMFLSPALSGLLLIFGFFGPGFYWIIGFSLVPLFFFIKNCPSKKYAFFGGWLAGFIFYGYLISYFLSAYPLDWAGINSYWGLFLVFGIWIINVMILSSFTGFFSFFAKAIMRKNDFWAVLGVPSLWIIFEYFKSWSFGVIWFGPGALLGPHWSIGHLGYALANNAALLQLAGFGGVYLLSFLVVLVNCLIFSIAKERLFLRILALVLLIVSVFALGGWELNKKSNLTNDPRFIKVALLQTDFPSAFWENFGAARERAEIHLSLLEKIKKSGEDAELIVATERTGLLKTLPKFFSESEIRKILADMPGVMVDIASAGGAGEQSSILIYYNPKTGRIIGEQEKLMLVPGGEYLPYNVQFLAPLFGGQSWLRDFLFLRGYQSGQELKVADLGFGKVGGLFCSEILSPVLYRSLTKQGAEILINVASDSIFHGSPLLLSENLAMAKVRAAENNRYFLQAANAGFSYIINNAGEIVSKIVPEGNDVIFGEAEIISQKSFYAEKGDWILIFAVLFIFIFGYFSLIK